jgi:hypothetical protein
MDKVALLNVAAARHVLPDSSEVQATPRSTSFTLTEKVPASISSVKATTFPTTKPDTSLIHDCRLEPQYLAMFVVPEPAATDPNALTPLLPCQNCWVVALASCASPQCWRVEKGSVAVQRVDARAAAGKEAAHAFAAAGASDAAAGGRAAKLRAEVIVNDRLPARSPSIRK